MNKKRRSTPSTHSNSRSGRNKGLSIGEFHISDLTALRHLADYKSLLRWCACTIVIILTMVQIRSALNSVPSSVVDRSPSYRFYKYRYLKKVESSGFLISLGICQIAPFMDADPALLNNSIYSYIYSPGDNAPLIERLNSHNYYMYFHGVVSRMRGILNSCPSTNSGLFNFPKDAVKLGLQDILKSLPFPEGDIDFDKVKSDLVRLGLGDESEIVLEENLLVFPGGVTPLEKDIFGAGAKLKRVSHFTIALGPSSTLPDKRMDRASLESVIFPLELLQYDKSVGTNPTILKQLSEKAAGLPAQSNQVGPSEEASATSGVKPSPSALASEGTRRRLLEQRRLVLRKHLLMR